MATARLGGRKRAPPPPEDDDEEEEGEEDPAEVEHEIKKLEDELELKWKKRLHDEIFPPRGEVHMSALQHAFISEGIFFDFPKFKGPILERYAMNVLVCHQCTPQEKWAMVKRIIKTYHKTRGQFAQFGNDRSTRWKAERRKHVDKMITLIRACVDTEIPLRYTWPGLTGHPDTFSDASHVYAVIMKFTVDDTNVNWVARVKNTEGRDYLPRGIVPVMQNKTYSGMTQELVPFTGAMRVYPNQFMLGQARFFVPKMLSQKVFVGNANLKAFAVSNIIDPHTGARREKCVWPRVLVEIIMFHFHRVKYEGLIAPKIEQLLNSKTTYYERHTGHSVWNHTDI